MGPGEYAAIDAELRRRCARAGHGAPDINARRSARMLRLASHFMAEYGLRVSSLLSLEIHDEYITYTAKGIGTRDRHLRPGTRALLEELGVKEADAPFANVGKSTIQNGIRRVTLELADRGEIRHAYSAHDFRHLFAAARYRDTRDLYDVQLALDHASPTVTTTYLAGMGVKTS